jgi:hypothetical protein
MLCLLSRTATATTATTRCLVRQLPVVAKNHHSRSLFVLAADDDEQRCEGPMDSIKHKTRGSDIQNSSQNSRGYGGVVDFASMIKRRRDFINLQQQQQQQHKRWLATYGGGNKGYYKHSLGRGKKEQDCPFVVLGLSATPLNPKDGGDRGISFTTVKKTFLKIAMARHPDTSKSKTKDEVELDKKIFLASLQAFEKIAAGPDGVAVLRSELEGYQEDESENDLNAWFKQETGGFDMPFMDARTIKEVAEMTETIGGGLDRDGGMWTLARMVTESAKSGNGDGMSILQLEAGNVRDRNINGILRRKRNR